MTIRLSLGAVAAVAFIAAVAIPRTAIPLIDGDVWWHLRAGEAVLSSGQVPRVDEWTIVGQGMRWTSQDWLTNAVMAWVNRAGGPWGPTLLSLLFAAMVGASFGLLWSALGRRRPRPGWLGRLGWLALGLIVAGPIAGVRVQTVDLLMTATTVWTLWSYLDDRRPAWLVAIPLISLVWVNLHAGWPLLVALIGAVVVGEAADRLAGRSLAREPLAWRQIGWLAAVGGAALAAVAINPNGIEMYGYPFTAGTIGALRDFIFEWSRPDLASFPGQMIFVLMISAVVPTLIVARGTIPLADALWLMGLAALSLTAVRFALVAGPVCAAIAAIHLSPHVARLPALTDVASVASRMERTPGPAATRVNLAIAGLVAVVGLTLAVARVTPDVQRASIVASMPVETATWLRHHDPDAQIFNVYAWGGYLGRELPDARVYIDGRADIYGDARIREYARAIALETDPAPVLARAAVDTVVFWPDSALAGWLDEHGWERVHQDPVAVIWKRARTGG